jgi:hypothetical protein
VKAIESIEDENVVGIDLANRFVFGAADGNGSLKVR